MKLFSLANSLVIVALCVTPAHAALIKQTYTGTVSRGGDLGAFGVGENLEGKEFEAIFIFDTLLGTLSAGDTLVPTGGKFAQLVGGSSPSDPYFGKPTPLVKATLSIGGSIPVTINAGQEDRTAVRSFPFPTPNSVQTLAPNSFVTDAVGADSLTAILQSRLTTFPDSLTVLGEYLSSDQSLSTGTFNISGKANGFLNVQKLVVSSFDETVDPPSAQIPLPAALPLFATSIAVLGIASRKRRNSVTPA
ncbi:MAG: hypothetical protein U1E46_05875 [Hyphomicrobiales bacterium]